MTSQHLSDEAVAAYADGVLRGHARDRASRHVTACAECAAAVRGQREAVLALRAAPAPGLPSGLLDRLRAVPATTPLDLPPTSVTADGTTVFATFGSHRSGSAGPSVFGSMAAAALVPQRPEQRPEQRPDGRPRLRPSRPLLLTAAAVATAGALAVGSGAAATSRPSTPVRPASVVQQGGLTGIAPVGFQVP